MLSAMRWLTQAGPVSFVAEPPRDLPLGSNRKQGVGSGDELFLHYSGPRLASELANSTHAAKTLL